MDCINPFNGAAVPVFATNYVLAGFGTGAGRTANQRDLERRIDQLEEKMDRLLQALESKQKEKK